MDTFLLMPNALHCINPNLLTNIVLTTNEYKLYLDNTRYLISQYEEIASENQLLKSRLDTVLDYLIDNESYEIIDNTLKLSLDDKHEYIEFLKEYTYENRNIIVCDKNEFNDYSNDIMSYEINIINEDNISKVFRTPVKKSFQEQITESMIDTLAEMSLLIDTNKIEDLHTMQFIGGLRTKGYKNISEQAFAGSSGTGKSAGQLDALIRTNMGKPISIIEAMKLGSFGSENKLISSQVYFEEESFVDKWKTYQEYINDLNNKDNFQNDKAKLLSFKEITIHMHEYVDIKVGLSIHERHDREVEVIHFFCNFCPTSQKVI